MALRTAPTNVMVYKPTRNTYSIGWQVSPIVGDTLSLFDCEVQVDTVNTFDSINLKTYTKDNPKVSYQNGNFFKAFVFNDISSLQDFTYYFRVRINSTLYSSPWSSVTSFDITKVLWKDTAQLMLDLMPRTMAYTTDGLLNYYKLLEAYSREIQEVRKETIQIGNNVNFYKTQDSDLYDTLGSLLESIRNSNSPFIEYRYELLELWRAFQEAGTASGVLRFIKSIFGLDATISLVRDRLGWVVWDDQVLPILRSASYSNPYAQFYSMEDGSSYTQFLPNLQPSPDSKGAQGFYWSLKIYNGFGVTTRKQFIEAVVNKLKPLNTTVYFEYYTYTTSLTDHWGVGSFGGSGHFGQKSPQWVRYTPID